MARPVLTERPRLTAVRGAWLFDGVSPTLVPNPVVTIEGGVIRSVMADGALPETADVLDLPGATLLPGLVDTHVHLAFDGGPSAVEALAARDEPQTLVAMIEAGRQSLRAGVTTVRDLGDRNYLTLQLRGRADMPTIVAAGPPLTTTDGHCHYLGGGVVPTEDAVRAAVRQHADRGVDVIKIMASGGNITPGSRQELSQFDAATLRAAVDEAHRCGLPITAHAHGTPAIADALAAGVDGMEHVSFWAADGVDAPAHLLLALAQSPVVIGATLGVRPVPGFDAPPGVLARLPQIIANTARLREMGAAIVVGTDAGVGPTKPHGVLADAVAMAAVLGFSPAQALRLVTSVAAAVCGLADRKGRLAAGFDADLLAVDGEPVQDPTAVQRPRAVFVRGTPVALG